MKTPLIIRDLLLSLVVFISWFSSASPLPSFTNTRGISPLSPICVSMSAFLFSCLSNVSDLYLWKVLYENLTEANLRSVTSWSVTVANMRVTISFFSIISWHIVPWKRSCSFDRLIKVPTRITRQLRIHQINWTGIKVVHKSRQRMRFSWFVWNLCFGWLDHKIIILMRKIFKWYVLEFKYHSNTTHSIAYTTTNHINNINCVETILACGKSLTIMKSWTLQHLHDSTWTPIQFWFTNFSRVLPTSQVSYYTGKPIENAIYFLNSTSSTYITRNSNIKGLGNAPMSCLKRSF